MHSPTASPPRDDAPTDEELAARIGRCHLGPVERDNAVRAYEALYRRHGHRLLGYLAARVARSELDDVFQTVWQRVWEHVGTKFQGGNFRAWLHQIARNHLIDESRRKRPGSIGEDTLVPDRGHSDPGDALVESERREHLERCLEHLREDMLEIVRGRLGGESYEVICARTELSPARAHKLFHLAKEQLGNCLDRSLR